ncbi:MAG: cysteine--tRNA ligase [Candidatus Magasanikbacteria bacterium CG10_big_fil_rev_8_21_14_0_10_36_32]|uniref:Cysteine--tRNA ligase n=1 Tax=Candidatus Magasanikbacteria bacterium CG10_big_fil_rev_8_21_14_0_10_36_32 TaxID=1974646 RepID=A0A2M6W5M9_9BACT|nr:MAG: cysteine--tRNA ligase [Candidatus Magasanikbacteria bacterium CG10_big_fil_rev_8_21_14_0_10_36_32]
MNINLYNTLNRKIEEFKPIKDRKVGIYTCGPTVYNYAHIGNLRSYIFEDILKRVLKYNGYKVKHVMNITDVGHLTSDADEGEDKMEKGAKREGKSAWDIAAFYIKAFRENLADLNIEEPDIWCRATVHIKEQIKLIKKLEKKGFIYETSDGIYFDTSKLNDYGKLAQLNKDELLGGARVNMGGKKNITDFALWKFSPFGQKRQMEWSSPWGVGFPGWHIECSAMSVKYLGQPFDIHCGGIDHVPVHHTNEIAQSETANGKTMANYWLHNEFIKIPPTNTNDEVICESCGEKYIPKMIHKIAIQGINREGRSENQMGKCPKCGLMNYVKMSKSSGNFITVNTLKEKGIDSLAYRYFLLQTHYRKQLNFSWEALEAAASGVHHLYQAAAELKTKEIKTDINLENEFLTAVNNDLDTPKALAGVWTAIKNKQINWQTILKFDEIFGLDIKNQVEKLDQQEELPKEIQQLIFKRDEARKNKNWQTSDEIRDRLIVLGYQVEDDTTGTKVTKI